MALEEMGVLARKEPNRPLLCFLFSIIPSGALEIFI
ncbi:hypothetical protein B23_0502 [Geobacillus thermoleovorans B23]|nr:hypothetical protein B23_0502 [Geobacillus thermoleovorans B23]